MKKLKVYGDSYVSDWNPLEKKSWWTRKLADKLGLEEENFAIPGSSVAYTVRKLASDLKNNNIKEDSVIIVLFSSLGRFYNRTSLNNFPSSGSLFLHEFFHDKDSLMMKYYYDNEQSIKWWLAENDHVLESINMESFIYWLYSFAAKKYVNHKFVVMFNSLYGNHDFSHINDTENFILLRDFSINQVSMNEIDSPVTQHSKYFELIKNTKNIDPRVNHLTNPNIDILVNEMEKIVLHNDTNGLRYDSFYSNIIKPIIGREDCKQYIDDNLLIENPYIMRTLK
jgi:hypothetical protein